MKRIAAVFRARKGAADQAKEICRLGVEIGLLRSDEDIRVFTEAKYRKNGKQ